MRNETLRSMGCGSQSKQGPVTLLQQEFSDSWVKRRDDRDAFGKRDDAKNAMSYAEKRARQGWAKLNSYLPSTPSLSRACNTY